MYVYTHTHTHTRTYTVEHMHAPSDDPKSLASYTHTHTQWNTCTPLPTIPKRLLLIRHLHVHQQLKSSLEEGLLSIFDILNIVCERMDLLTHVCMHGCLSVVPHVRILHVHRQLKSSLEEGLLSIFDIYLCVKECTKNKKLGK